MWLTLITLTLFQLLKVSSQSFSINSSAIAAMPVGVSPITVLYDVSGSFFYLGGNTNVTIDNETYVGLGDAFLAKLFLNGTRVWSRIVGSSAFDNSRSIVQNPSTLDVFLIGLTNSLSVDNQNSSGGADGLIVKFASNGTRLFTRLIGTAGSDQFNDVSYDMQAQQFILFGLYYNVLGLVTVDINNGSVLKQFTFPVEGAANRITTDSNTTGFFVTGRVYGSIDNESYYGGSDIFLTNMNAMNGTRYWTRIWGNSSGDEGNAVQFDRDSQLVFVTGMTTGGSIKKYLGFWDVLLICAQSNGTHLWTRQFGTRDSDTGHALLLHRPTGTLFVIGSSNIYGFVASFLQNGTMLQFTTQATASLYYDVCVDPTWNKAYIANYQNHFATLQISGNYSGFSESSLATRSTLIATTNVTFVSTSSLLSTPIKSRITDISVIDPVTFETTTSNSPPPGNATNTFVFGANMQILLLSAGAIVLLIVLSVLARLFLVRRKLFRRNDTPKEKISIHDKTNYDNYTNNEITNFSFNTLADGTRTNSTSMATMVRSTYELSLPGFLMFDNGPSFRINRKIGQGGGGQVFAGDAFASPLQRFGNKIVIKVIGCDNEVLEGLTPQKRKSFEQEVSLMHLLRDQKNIAKLLGWSTSPACILMKMYERGSLDSWIYGQVKATKRLELQFIQDIAKGLRAIHDAGFAHCDLKPQNVLLDSDEHGKIFCVLTDFGISRLVNNSALLVKDFKVSNLRGLSFRYAAPEALNRFRSSGLTESCSGHVLMKGDLYSLGVMVQEILTRKLPWK